MTILFDAAAPVKPARRFGAGLLATYPTHRVDYSADDAAWWAEESARLDALDRHADRLAAESHATDRLSRGLCC